MKNTIAVSLATMIAVTSTFVRVPPASALTKGEGFPTRSVETNADRQLCSRLGGEIKRDQDGDYYCESSRKDRECSEKFGDAYRFDYRSNTCKEDLCFFTTACCDELGLRDDCWELRTLRRYRDTYLAGAAGGKEDIETYYSLAPQVLESIPGDTRRQDLLVIYAFMILPCAVLAKLGFNRLTRQLYTTWTRALAKRYGLRAGIADAAA